MQGFGVSAFEAFNEFFGFGNELLLFVVSLLLLFTTFFAEFQIFGIIYFIIIDTSHRHFNGTGSDIIYKLAVVADDNNSFTIIDKEIFQPLNTFDVEVVGRLIQ